MTRMRFAPATFALGLGVPAGQRDAPAAEADPGRQVPVSDTLDSASLG
jgi:hypothetical protein